MLKVVNIHRESYDEYIGRPGKGQSSPLGNRYEIGKYYPEAGKVLERGDGVKMYRVWLWKQILAGNSSVCNELKRLYRLSQNKEIRLGCFCKPHDCHGDMIVAALSSARVREILGI